MAHRPNHPELQGPKALERLVETASMALEDGRPEEALRGAEEALLAAPHEVKALHLRAAALEDLGRTRLARDAYARALSDGKNDRDLVFGAARFLIDGLPEEEQDLPDLEEGLSLARRGGRLAKKALDPELESEFDLLEARALSGLDRPEEALQVLSRAAKAAPDEPAIQLELGIALYELCLFDEAKATLASAEAQDPDDPWISHQLGLLAERRGDEAEARRRFARAHKLSPGEFPKPPSLSKLEFEGALENALASLPEKLRGHLSNVAVTVDDLPSDEELQASSPPLSPGILGLFRGAPYGQKASMDPWSHFPSSIVLFQRNLERAARTRDELLEQIRITLVHEVGHYLGLSEDELYERGLE